MNLRRAVVGLCAAVAFVGLAESSAFADFCVVDDNPILPVGYQLKVGTATPATGTPVVVTGERLVALLHRHSVFGSLRTLSSGAVVIALETVFDFGSGTWAHPVGSSVFVFPPNGGTPTYDTTYHGNGAPTNSKGNLHFAACPLSATDLGVVEGSAQTARDPNAAR